MNGTNKSIEILIREKLGSFSKRERIIADYFITHNVEAAFLSIHDISEKLAVGRASIVRFAQKLGYEGFYEMKQDIQSRIQTEIAPMEKYQLALKESASRHTSIIQIAENEVNNINYLINNFDQEVFEKAAKIIAKADMVFCTGFNMSSFPAGILSFLLQRIGIKSFATNLGGRALEEQLINIGKKDVLVVFSNPPYSVETIRATEFAKKQGCTVIAITNSLTAPIVQHSDVVLSVKSDSRIFTNSFSAVLVLIYALVDDIAIHNKIRFSRAMDKKHTSR